MLFSALNVLEDLGDAPNVAETILGLLPETGVMIVDPRLRIVVMRGPVYACHGYDGAGSEGRDLHDVIPAEAWTRLGEHWLAALAGEPRTVDTVPADGNGNYWLHFTPLKSNHGVIGAMMVAQDMAGRERGHDETRLRLTQQAAVSALGSLALEGRPVTELVAEATQVLHGALTSDLTMVLETTLDGAVTIRASAGEAPPRPPGPSPGLRRSIGHMRDAAETLLTRDLSETTLRAPGLAAAGMVSLVASPIGAGATAFGELVACSRRPAAFSQATWPSWSRWRTC